MKGAGSRTAPDALTCRVFAGETIPVENNLLSRFATRQCELEDLLGGDAARR